MHRVKFDGRWLSVNVPGIALGLMLALVPFALALAGPAAAPAAVSRDGALSLTPPAIPMVGPGSGLELVWTITNRSAVSRLVTLEITVSRSWPLARVLPSIEVPPDDSVRFLVPSSVPDTAAAGIVHVSARVHLDSDATTLDSCASELVVLSGPQPGVPVLVAADLVRVEWITALRWPDSGIVELSRDHGSWFPAGGISADASGRCAFDDHGVTPGGIVDYRLRATLNGLTMVSEVTTVNVPSRTPFAIAGLSPNPGNAAAVIAFTLAERATTRLDVYDMAGRRVWARELGVLAPGPHRQALDPHAPLRSGVYVFRLTSGGRSASARGVITR